MEIYFLKAQTQFKSSDEKGQTSDGCVYIYIYIYIRYYMKMEGFFNIINL